MKIPPTSSGQSSQIKDPKDRKRRLSRWDSPERSKKSKVSKCYRLIESKGAQITLYRVYKLNMRKRKHNRSSIIHSSYQNGMPNFWLNFFSWFIYHHLVAIHVLNVFLTLFAWKTSIVLARKVLDHKIDHYTSLTDWLKVFKVWFYHHLVGIHV